MLMNTPAQARALTAAEGMLLDMLGDLITFKAFTHQTNGAYCMFEGRTAPGSGVTPHYHPAEDESFYVLEGRYTFIVGDEQIAAGPGTYVFVPRRTVHAFSNTGGVAGRLLVTVTPGFEHEQLFLRAGRRLSEPDAPLTTPTPEQIGEFLEMAPAYGTIRAGSAH